MTEELNDLVKNVLIEYDNENEYIEDNDINLSDWREWKKQGYSDDGFITIIDCYYLAGNATTGNMTTIDSIDEVTNLLINEMDETSFNDVIELMNGCKKQEDCININNTYDRLEAYVNYCYGISIFKQTEGKYKGHYCLVIE